MEQEVLLMDEKGHRVNDRVYVFQQTEWRQINDNPDKLTKAGIDKKIELWRLSSNRHTVAKYQTMLKSCKNVAESGFVEAEIADGTDTDGKPKKKKIKLKIYSRHKNGKPKWAESVEEYLEKKNS